MKRWLVICNDQYYPAHGTGDWHGPYAVHAEAVAVADKWTNSDRHHTAEVIDLFEVIGISFDLDGVMTVEGDADG